MINEDNRVTYIWTFGTKIVSINEWFYKDMQMQLFYDMLESTSDNILLTTEWNTSNTRYKQNSCKEIEIIYSFKDTAIRFKINIQVAKTFQVLRAIQLLTFAAAENNRIKKFLFKKFRDKT